VLVLLFLLPACATALRGCFSRERSHGPAEPADPGPPRDEIAVPECAGLGGSNEDCQIALRIDETRCHAEHRCERAVVLIPNDASDCGRQARVLRVFAEAGLVAACIALYESEGAARVATLAGREERARTAIDALGRSEQLASSWSRAELVLSGDGLGAGTAMRTLVRTQSVASAERVSACFFDGIFDVALHYESLRERQEAGGRCRDGLDAVALVYCDARSEPPECAEEAVASMRDDSVDVADPGAVLGERVLLFECGSELSSCDEDAASAAQAESLCESLGEARCEKRSAPRVRTDRCAVRNVDACIEWLSRT
jgi:hypothetical protein